METFSVTTWNLQEKLGWEEQRPGVFEELRRAAGDQLGIVALCDAFREVDTRTQRKIPRGEVLGEIFTFAERLGFTAFHTLYEDTVPYPPNQDLQNLEQNLVVLSNMPVLESRAVRLASRKALSLTVEHEGERVHSMAAHFDSRSPFTRMAHTQAYLPYRKQASSDAVLLAGDLNVPHRCDWRARALRTGPAQRLLHSQFVPYYGPRLAEQVRDPILEILEQEGRLQDADPRHTPTMYGPGGFPYLQLDHILHGSALRTVSFIPGRRGPSDHRWVQAELAFTA